MYSASFNCLGTLIASCGEDKLIKVWDAETGQELRSFGGHQGPVNCVAFSPCGKMLASANDDGSVKIWDSSTGNEVKTLKGHTDKVLFV